MSKRLEIAQDAKHLNFLDGMRGIAVSYVLLYHFMPKTLSLKSDYFVYKIWDTFWLMGWSGVDLFFVLSGFLITGILYKSKGKKNYFKNFYLRRIFRIFPAYYSLIVIAILYFGKNFSVYYWLYLSNFDVELAIDFNLFLCVAWSLSIEEQYYLFYPTLVYFLNDRQWINTLIIFIFLSISLRFAGHYFEFFSPRQMYHHTLAHFDGIALGGLLRMLLFNYDRYKNIINLYLKLLPLLLIGAFFLGYYCGIQVLESASESNGKVVLGHVSFYPLMYLVGYTLNSLVFGGIIVWCIFKEGIVFSFFSNPVLRNIGRYSYAMYLFQFPSSVLFEYLIKLGHLHINPIFRGLLLFIFCYLIARISWLLIEGPISRLKDKLAPSHP